MYESSRAPTWTALLLMALLMAAGTASGQVTAASVAQLDGWETGELRVVEVADDDWVVTWTLAGSSTPTVARSGGGFEGMVRFVEEVTGSVQSEYVRSAWYAMWASEGSSVESFSSTVLSAMGSVDWQVLERQDGQVERSWLLGRPARR